MVGMTELSILDLGFAMGIDVGFRLRSSHISEGRTIQQSQLCYISMPMSNSEPTGRNTNIQKLQNMGSEVNYDKIVLSFPNLCV